MGDVQDSEATRLFPDVERVSEDARRYSAPHYDYLLRSARSEAGRIRDVLEAWLTRYPAEHRARLAAEFRRDEDEHFLAAFFDLYLHEIVSKLGCRLEVHPPVPGTSRSPDFLVRGAVSDAYLEATLATEPAIEQLRGDARVDSLLDAVREIDSPHFLLHVARRGRPPRLQPSQRKLVDRVTRWLQDLDPDASGREFDEKGTAALPVLEHVLEEGGPDDEEPVSWLVIRASPRRSPQGRAGALGSISNGRFVSVSLGEAIRQSLEDKASRYGRPGMAYVVAVSVRHRLISLDLELCEEALFGEVAIAPALAPGESGREVRTPDGFWRGRSKPQNTRVSAVLLVGNLTPWSLAQAHQQPMLYLNPWAEHPYDGELTRLPTGRFDEATGRVSYTPGVHPRDLLGLAGRWPEVDT